MSKVTTNFGSISGQRIVSFDTGSKRDVVVPVGWASRGWDFETMMLDRVFKDKLITPREAFRRWKIARKAWQSRKWRHQLSLQL